MKKLLLKASLLMIVLAIVLLGSGLVQVDVHGNGKKYMKGPVGTLVQQAVDLIESSPDYDEDTVYTLTLKADKKEMARDYIIDDGKHLKLKNKYDGWEHVVLEGTIEGPGQELDITIDADYSQNAMSGTIAIGDYTDIERQAFGVKGSTVLTRNIGALAVGDTSSISTNTVWNGTPALGYQHTITEDLVSQTGFSVQGYESYGLYMNNFESDNWIYQASQTVLTGESGKYNNKYGNSGK